MHSQHALDGIVLVGGRSKRMGRDKALIKNSNGERWLETTIDRLRPFCRHVFVSGQADQRVAWAPIIHPTLPLVTWVDDREPDAGPMSGLLSVMSHAQHAMGDDAAAGYLLLATDLPWLTNKVLERLVDQWRCSADMVAANCPPVQPLVTIYPAKVRDSMQQGFASGQRSLRKFLAAHPHDRVPADSQACKNCNKPEDWGIS
ncbi:MAG: molybdenum cofactor guanylyltransferase [Planctomycetota bacterium]